VKHGGMFDRVLKAVALAMGVAVVVLSIWQVANPATLITLLAIGLLALAVAVL
jgi:hypothetical protein